MNKTRDAMNLIGLSVKQIGISKGLTQSYISNYCKISQINYAKFVNIF